MSTEQERESIQLQAVRRIVEMLKETEYPMAQHNGQRRYGPPQDMIVNGSAIEPPRGCEVYFARLPTDMFEDELVPIFAKIGRIFELRLLLEFSGMTRGFGFVKYTTLEEAQRAVDELNGLKIRGTRHMLVTKSKDNRRLYMGGLPQYVTKADMLECVNAMVPGVVDVLMYNAQGNTRRNRGYAFVEFETHHLAAMARRVMLPGGVMMWDKEISVQWARPEHEVDQRIMSQVKILFVRNLPEVVNEAALVRFCDLDNCIMRVKKIKDFAFIHFINRESAEQAKEKLSATTVEGLKMDVSWAKPKPKPSPDAAVSEVSANSQESTNGNQQAPSLISTSTGDNSFNLNLIRGLWEDWTDFKVDQAFFSSLDMYFDWQFLTISCLVHNIGGVNFKFKMSQNVDTELFECVGFFNEWLGTKSCFYSMGAYYTLEQAFGYVLTSMLHYLSSIFPNLRENYHRYRKSTSMGSEFAKYM